MVAAHPVGGLSALEQFEALVMAFGVDAAMADGGHADAVQACSSQAPDRRAVCGALAERMVAQGRTLTDVAIGARLAARAGLPPLRLAAAEQRWLALRAAQRALSESLEAPDAAGCTGPARLRAQALAVGTAGEVGVLDAWIAASGRSEAAWAQAQRTADAPPAGAGASAAR